jgi:hypothetical protein
MPLTDEDQGRIIDLHFHQHKPIREISKIMGKSTHDITPVTKEYRIRLTQDNSSINKEQNIGVSGGRETAQKILAPQDRERVITNVQAYKLFSKGKTSLEVTAELNLPGPEILESDANG